MGIIINVYVFRRLHEGGSLLDVVEFCHRFLGSEIDLMRGEQTCVFFDFKK